ncbi:major tail protein [Gordonia phage DirtyBoi]|nr:major tail protein [Gordonia phage DirtyBoi]
MPATINPDASHIWDEAEVYILPKAALNGAPIEGSAFEPDSVNEDFTERGWLFVGLIDAAKGIPVTPEGEVKKFNGFGHTAYRTKFVQGQVQTGFTALEDNAVTAQIVLPGSSSDKIGVPRDLQFYVLYRTVDSGAADLGRMSLRPALLELTEHSGAVEGEQEMYEFTVHHSADANKDVFKKIGNVATTDFQVTITGAPTGGTFTLTYEGKATTALAYNASAATVKSALVALDDGYDASDFAVAGSAGGPYAISVPKPGSLSASGSFTGGTSPDIEAEPAA